MYPIARKLRLQNGLLRDIQNNVWWCTERHLLVITEMKELLLNFFSWLIIRPELWSLVYLILRYQAPKRIRFPSINWEHKGHNYIALLVLPWSYYFLTRRRKRRYSPLKLLTTFIKRLQYLPSSHRFHGLQTELYSFPPT